MHPLDTIKNIQNQKTNLGFTLIETLVAITILMTSIMGPLTIASRSLRSSYYARDQIVAFYLAQDAIEFIRNKRDSNRLDIQPWLSGVAGPDACENACYIDSGEGSISSCQGSCEDPLQYNGNLGIYGYTEGPGWAPSYFSRSVKVQEVAGSDNKEAKVSVSIKWRSGPITQEFTVEENIFDWQ